MPTNRWMYRLKSYGVSISPCFLVALASTCLASPSVAVEPTLSAATGALSQEWQFQLQPHGYNQTLQPDLDESRLSTSSQIYSQYEPGSNLEIPDFSKRLRQDLRALVLKPATMDPRAWRRLGAGLALVGAVSIFDDEFRSAADPGGRGSGIARTLRPLGQEMSLAVLGGAWLAGKASGKEPYKSIARDGLEASILAAGLIVPLTKRLAGRGRPINGFSSRTFLAGNESFPSGEATQAFTIAAVISAHSQRKWVKALAWGLASTVSYHRIELDAHWASDVTAGALLGSAMGRWVVRRHHLEIDRRSSWSVAPQLSPSSAGVAARWSR